MKIQNATRESRLIVGYGIHKHSTMTQVVLTIGEDRVGYRGRAPGRKKVPGLLKSAQLAHKMSLT
jgi:hypothetical protein